MEARNIYIYHQQAGEGWYVSGKEDEFAIPLSFIFSELNPEWSEGSHPITTLGVSGGGPFSLVYSLIF